MRTVVTENQEILRQFIEANLEQKMPEESTFIGQENDGKLVAVVCFTGFIKNSCTMHIASIGNNWMTKDLLWSSFDYPFIKLQKKVILIGMNASNKEAVKLNRHLGFEEKALIEDAHEKGDLLLMTMRKEQCKWLNIKNSFNKGN